jgi:phosphatidate cytidylyltransferase
VLAGVGGCVLGALVSTLFTELDLSGAAVIGVLVGLAALLGDLASLMLRSELGVGERETSVPGYGGIVGPLATVLFVAPAFFYGLRFYVA